MSYDPFGISALSGYGNSFWQVNRVASGVVIILIYLAIVIIFGVIISGFISKIYRDQDNWLTPISGRIVNFFEKIIGEGSERQMKFREYFLTLLFFNAAAGVISFIFIFYQRDFPFAFANNHMTASLTFNTVSSFITNTNLQHYSNPFDLSYLSQTFVITGLMFLSAGTGFAASMAFIRGILQDKGTIGNFYHDFLVSIFYLILPLTLLVTVILIVSGIPETTLSYISVQPVFSSVTYKVPLGSVATLEAIKNIGTNGGGFYGANAAFPFENPNWFTNITEFTSFLLIPLGSIIALGKVFSDRRFMVMLVSVLMVFFVFTAFLTFYGEITGIPSLSTLGVIYNGNMVGKETSIGIAGSSIFSIGATITSTGAANAMLAAYSPAGLLGNLVNLLINDPVGGIGTGVLNIFTSVIFTVFIASLMVGKLPELMSIKIGSKEIKYSTLSLITHPLLIIIPLGITLMIPSIMASFPNPKPDAITELLYEFATSASNNGSEVGGFLTNQLYFNVLDGIIMILGRYVIMGFQLKIADLFSNKKPKVEMGKSIDTGSFYFGLMLLGVMILVGLLSFFPILALGPILSWAKAFEQSIWMVIR
ncbi:MAG: potassium-transporting ATPase subunit KdpA [Candidatus Thermoplasmatota archaeon]|nr:potassium-transporting ATPase subunit KdpA [Candidatus Thermoplasmatota archaeon]MCL5667545.1 potassium-transporting ATPase subunit KdpA [Candidatus Thermoplasmatota archaeon]